MTVTLTPEQRLTVVKHLAAGKAHHVVATIARLNVKVVQEIGDEHGYPDRDLLTAAAHQLEQDIDRAAAPPPGGGWARKTMPHAGDPPTRRPNSSPAVAASTPPAAEPDLRSTTKAGTLEDPFPRVDDDQTVRLRNLINAAKGISDKRIQRQLERALDALTSLQDLVSKHRAAVDAKDRQEREQATARAEVDRLKKQLAAAQAKLRGQPHKPRSTGTGAGGRGLASTEDLEQLGTTSKDVRTWAHDSGVDCPAVGRLPSRVLDAWKAAHADESRAS